MLIIGKMMPLLNLIRWKNLLIILLTEAVIKFALMDYFFASSGLSYRMTNEIFVLLALSSIFIAAAGYIINDINDVEIDSVNNKNRPLVSGDIKISTANILLYAFNIIGVVLAFYVAFETKKIGLAAVQLFVMALLYGYSNFYKCSKLVGNILVSLTTALVPFLIWIYTIYDVLAQGFMFSYDLRWMHLSVGFYMLFAFLSNMVRELLKDKEDADADMVNDCNTWAASVSARSLKSLILFILLLLIILLVAYQYFFPISILFRSSLSLIYTAIFAYVIPKLYKANTKGDYYKLSVVMKIIMLIGVISPVILWL